MPFGSVRSVSSIYSSSESTGRCSCCRYPWSASAAVVWLLIILSQLLPTSGSALCSRCETPELAALHRYYDTLGTTAITFRQFVTNLLRSMSQMSTLQPLYDEMTAMIWRYDDCMRTCEIPFFLAKRFSHRDKQQETEDLDGDNHLPDGEDLYFVNHSSSSRFQRNRRERATHSKT